MPKARMPRVQTAFFSVFMGLQRPRQSERNGMVQRSTAEVNKKVMGTFAGGFQGAKGGDGGERDCRREKGSKAQAPGKAREGHKNALVR